DGGRNGDLRDAPDAGREVGADVTLEAGSACRGSDHAELIGDVGRDRAGLLESREHRRRIPQELHRAGDVAKRRFDLRVHRARALGIDVEGDAERPQNAAVGRKPTSPASAPRSPVWLASRSSSSAMARSACARGGTRASASASNAWQYAVAWPTDVSPASVFIKWIVRAS